MPSVKKIRGLNPPGTPWATSACCGRPLPFFLIFEEGSFHRLTHDFRFVMVHLHFIWCHNDLKKKKKSLIFILMAQQKLLANFKSLSFHPCHEHIRNPLCKNLLISKNINKVTHMFLLNGNFDSNFFLTDLKSFFNLSC